MKGRYSRQELFTPIGKDGQRLISAKHVLIIGAGALGSGSAEALVRAGIGKLTIVDRDYVEWSNLQRQQLYTEEDAKNRLPKAVAAKNRLNAINSSVSVEALIADASVIELEEWARKVDLIIDATDNFETRMILNDVSQKFAVPWIYGACVGSYGISYTIVPGRTPCLSCLLETVPLGGMTCDTAGIISPAVNMVVSYQISEALKILVDDLDSLRNRLVSFDVWKNQYSAISVDLLKKADCPSCGIERSYPFLAFENQTKTAVLCGRDSVQIRPSSPVVRDLEGLEKVLLKQGGVVQRNPYLLSYQADSFRLVVFRDGRVMVHGTKDVAEAKGLYHQYLG
ncbi:thiazole biosynthesis adenylyltransferase ThiF [Neobacillus niacini]|uniref:thiazole biosynthesis adenylyltransferase ThiF n=1 Tax=Neobacillus niacini TaxID=86668 RepID=UPI00285A5E60|nr:thiazole biosynthesis adenylyltransferase ThiF [Neobacillus niacini]MDR7000117.1 molybdopterin/thiamine biosynthesis adenylyltransferase [Neobacillus niacini]